MTEILDAETGELIPYESPAQLGGVLTVRDPAAMLEQASNLANQLKDVVAKADLVSKIGGKDYLTVEAWTTLGVLVGCTARTEWSRPLEDGWEAAVEVVNSHGLVIGRAEASCLRSERNWQRRDDYALRSMAQTRAMGKALRMPLGWIAALAGYQPTPAEEMPADPPAPDEPDLATKRQKDHIHRLIDVLGKEQGIEESRIREGMQKVYGTQITTKLTKAEAIDFITRLKKIAGEPES